MTNSNLKEKIIQTGLNYSQSQGLFNLTIRKVASLCQVSVGTIYNNFRDKESLYAAIAERYWQVSVEEELTKIVSQSQEYVKSIEEIYVALSNLVPDFHKLFRDTKTPSPELIKQGHSMTGQYYQKIYDKLDQLLAMYPEALNKIKLHGSVNSWNAYLIDNMLGGIQRKDHQLIFFKESLVRILSEEI